MADIWLAARCTQDHVTTSQLPSEVDSVLCEYKVGKYDFFFCIVDATQLIAANGPCVNLVCHPWIYQQRLAEAAYSSSLRMADLCPIGAFTYEGSSILPKKNGTCLPFQCLDRLRVSVHSQRGGGMCCSPNNGRFVVEPNPSSNISYMWTVALRKGADARGTGGARGAGGEKDSKEAGRKNAAPGAAMAVSEHKLSEDCDPHADKRGLSGLPTASVSLLWIVNGPSTLQGIIGEARNLDDLLSSLATIMPGAPCLTATFLAFRQLGVTQKTYFTPATPPLQCSRHQPGRDGEHDIKNSGKNDRNGKHRVKHEECRDALRHGDGGNNDEARSSGSHCDEKVVVAEGPGAPSKAGGPSSTLSSAQSDQSASQRNHTAHRPHDQSQQRREVPGMTYRRRRR